MQTAIASVIIFSMIIFVHEFGHYLLAKFNGILVEEFSLGMGPKLFSRKWKDTVYSLRVFPLGGFCRMAGEVGNEGYTSAQTYDIRRFDQKPVFARMSVVLAGPVMNFLLAALIFVAVFTILGLPQGYSNQIGTVVSGGVADRAGIKPGDKVILLEDQEIENWEQLVNIIHNSPGQELDITVDRNQTTLNLKVTPNLDAESNVGMIGISPSQPLWKKIGLWGGIKAGLMQTYTFTVLTLEGIVQLVSGHASSGDIAGPVGIVKLIDESTRFGLVYLANLTALISISLGLFNLLPIPALDGSRLLFMVIEAFRGRPVSPAKENFVHLIGFVFLMLLMIFVTYQDILRLFG